MAGFPSFQTSVGLLARLSQESPDPAAWADFVRRYGPVIQGWCRHWKLQQADAEDVAQTVLVKLAQKMTDFRYDSGRSFRAYLKTLARYAWLNFQDAGHRAGVGSGDSEVMELLHQVEAGDDLERRLNEQFDQELLARAQAVVLRRVEPHTWEAFHLTAVEGLSGAETAARLGLTVATVFKARSKVQRMLQEVVARLEGP